MNNDKLSKIQLDQIKRAVAPVKKSFTRIVWNYTKYGLLYSVADEFNAKGKGCYDAILLFLYALNKKEFLKHISIKNSDIIPKGKKLLF